MNILKYRKPFLVLVVLGFLLCSCEKREFSETVSVNNIDMEVSAELAGQVALNFSGGKSFVKKLSESKLKSAPNQVGFERKRVKEVIPITDNAGSPLMYVVNLIPNGYIVVSGTKKETPILGYSESSVFGFDKISEGMVVWMIDRMNKIDMLKHSDNIVVSKEVKEQWGLRSAPDDDEEVIEWVEENEKVGPLLSTLWGQWYGYNAMLDPVEGVLPPTGCVATAMAQVMKYHEFPTDYDWSSMSNYYGTSETARLMKDIGVAVNMEYTPKASFASLGDAEIAFVDVFGYSSALRCVLYDVSAVVYDIKSNLPVIMQAERLVVESKTSGATDWNVFNKFMNSRGNTAGHAWVCDGYKRTVHKKVHNPGTIYEYTSTVIGGPYFLHMNWGFDGYGMESADNGGWFIYDNFTLSNGYNYQYNKLCMVGIRKN